MSPASQSRTARTPAAKRARRQRLVGQAAATAVHALVLVLLLSGPPLAPHPAEPGPEPVPVMVELVPPPRPPAPKPAPKPAAPAPAPKTVAAAKPAPRKPVKVAKASLPRRLTPRPQPSEVPPRVVPPEPAPPAPEVAVSDAELASATTAETETAGGGGDDGEGAGGSAGGGGRCDMVGRLQRALRGDARVRAAVAGAHRAPGFAGRPLVIWNGDWVRHGDEDGKGLASVRQAIAVEVAFAPKACRAQSMHGLVLLSLNAGAGSTRLVLGAGSWRWSDLVYAR